MQPFHLIRAAVIAAALLSLLTLSRAQEDFKTKAGEVAPFGTPVQEEGIIASICGTQMSALGEAGCACLAGRAMTGLDKPQREYLILSVVQPPAADRTATAKSPADLKAVAAFLDTAGKDCAAATPADSTAPDAPAQQ